MIKNSPAIAFDPNERTIKPHPKLLEALEKNNETKKIFDGLSPSKRHEIIRLKFSAGI
jgi:uncharacterized protein YdeI (YjbR/CyaY-like superfamily)